MSRKRPSATVSIQYEFFGEGGYQELDIDDLTYNFKRKTPDKQNKELQKRLESMMCVTLESFEINDY